ncbi:hypothetical protein [Halorussus lipolyticus]|uniref:hypothetical protein n=1 Tax=Halorussus lipolyticus TaxID=3034024 RepID=UPI0023E8159D|nr:hypothetical protein [Halorussus sp. DT80]
MLTDAWNLRTEIDDDASHYLAVVAGVWCVALPTTDIDAEAVKQAVETVDTSRSPVVSALVTVLLTDETPPVPMQVRQNHLLTDDRHRHELAAWKSLLQLG